MSYERPISIIEKIADALLINRWFMRRRPVICNLSNDYITTPAEGQIEKISTIESDGKIPEKRIFGTQRFINLREVCPRGDNIEQFVGGTYCKIYLAPWNLHYLLFPCDGNVTEHYYVPGKILPLVFMKQGDVENERAIYFMNTNYEFPIASIMIGSFMVNGLRTYYEVGKKYKRGDESGAFSIGSSVVLLFPPGKIDLCTQEGQRLKFGTAIAKIK